MDLHQIKEELEKVNLKCIFTKLTDFQLNLSIKFALSTLTFTVKLNGNLVLGNGKLLTTWVKQDLDNILTCRIRHWLNLHPGVNIGHLKQSA